MNPEELGACVRERLPRHAPPAGLENRIRAAIAADRARESAAAPMTRRVAPIYVLGALAGMAAAFAVGVLWGQFRAGSRAFADEIVSAMVRARESGHLIDVASSDRHTVKPWLAGHLEFSPPVPDLSAQGYPLEGGRLDRAAGATCAALVYVRGRHTISVFIWPGAPSRSVRNAALLGYSIRTWTDNGFTFAASSDIAPNDLAAFIGLFRRDAD